MCKVLQGGWLERQVAFLGVFFPLSQLCAVYICADLSDEHLSTISPPRFTKSCQSVFVQQEVE